MLNKEDIKDLNQFINAIKDMRNKGIKARKDITLVDGTKVTIYHMGANNSTIRLDFKIED
jgi:hypothetical protein